MPIVIQFAHAVRPHVSGKIPAVEGRERGLKAKRRGLLRRERKPESEDEVP